MMISENPVTNRNIVDQIVLFHRNGKSAVQATPGIKVSDTYLEVDYGYMGTKSGTLRIERGQFEVTHVTKAGSFVPLASYNHSAEALKTKQAYIDALKQTDLSSHPAQISALIILTSESCRSLMVTRSLDILLNDGPSFSEDVWLGLIFAFKNYKKSAEFNKYQIQAGGVPWSWLSPQHYINYINSVGYTGDRQATLATINAVQHYIKTNHDKIV